MLPHKRSPADDDAIDIDAKRPRTMDKLLPQIGSDNFKPARQKVTNMCILLRLEEYSFNFQELSPQDQHQQAIVLREALLQESSYQESSAIDLEWLKLAQNNDRLDVLFDRASASSSLDLLQATIINAVKTKDFSGITRAGTYLAL